MAMAVMELELTYTLTVGAHHLILRLSLQRLSLPLWRMSHLLGGSRKTFC